ncbi:MBL fold metallo-hydrolase [Endozoicomonas sp. OPT23]|uniref:MBL fold metallo-hydrolase RNA specificity domain-containing protein n=1 Tax=Endozoicomonas sp. OPT23 TaxID=2072845 RepID=UPI00129B7EF1|nr:MBL fold metallo-hydrolase [Endozoicomonas sp. OPT23]MRI32931.1 MBL fold metallo-hydrolase [Endozoicomonas sp. OPT23]
MELQFLGATGTVTGSKYLVTIDDKKILVDCGLYQGVKHYRQMNRQPLPVKAEELSAIVLTHAHLDHSGYLPLLIKQGYSGAVYATPGTCELCKILLPDSGFLQEEDAKYAKYKGYSKHNPPLPLYTEEDARRALKHLWPSPFGEFHEILPGITIRFRPAGHILGAACVELFDGHEMLVFTGDVGRPDDVIMYPPESLKRADYLVMESTYGDRTHLSMDAEEALASAITETASAGGTVLIPAFAVGRAQMVLHILEKLRADNRIPKLPIYLNSPMAIKATEVFHRFHEKHRLTEDDCRRIDSMTHYVRTIEESKALADQSFPGIIVSASGMASGGRVLHHLKHILPNHRNSVLFVGYQAMGTRGEKLVNGAASIKIHGQDVPVRAKIRDFDGFSAHADSGQIVSWLKSIKTPPRQVFVTHGEESAAAAMAEKVSAELGWNARVPELLEKVTLK